MYLQCTDTYIEDNLICLDKVFSTLKFHKFVPIATWFINESFLTSTAHIENSMQLTELVHIR